MTGRFGTAPAGRRTVTFAFSGDEAGQGWGINTAWGGMKMYETMRRASPDFFIHSGDQIYADGPIKPEVPLEDGTIWRNATTPAKSKVAETLEEFRGNFAYNLLDDNKRRFCAEVPVLVQWDDHETRNNWYPEQMLGDERYRVRSASLLAALARRAMFEYNPFRFDPVDPERDLPVVSLRPRARGLHARRAQLSRAKHAEPPARPQRGVCLPGCSAARLAQAGAPGLARHLEGHRQRHAASASSSPI